MATFRHFEDIEAWQKGRALTQAAYRISRQGAFSSDFALRDQIRRACISITSNIAEGFERRRPREFIQFLSYAKASASEVRSQLYVALDEQYISRETFDELQALATSTTNQIGGLMHYLERNARRK